MRILATYIFGILFATLIGMYGAQVVNTWMHRADQVFMGDHNGLLQTAQ